jgi:tetratricopeptide (TPR) repeat protein
MKVFLSSTAQDLEAYRRVADDTILRLAQQSVAMERFGPLPNAPVEECERLARESDVVVCIVAHRYGFVPEKGRGSITRREVEAAYKAGKDVLVWIVDDNHPWTGKKEQDLLADPSVVADPVKIAEVAEGVAGLLNFKAWLRTTFTPETFTTPDDLGRKIAVGLTNYVNGRTAAPIPQHKISIARLPTTGSELFGREAELKLLDDVWSNPNINIVSFVAWGGVGKTALVNHWLKQRMARDNYRGAERVFAWSFLNQGSEERTDSADLFIEQALHWFGEADPRAGTPWDKGERLARYIRQSRTLLILDGIEPLQHPPGPQEGRLKDTALQVLLVELAAQQPGLCVISTRVTIADLIEFENGTVLRRDLEQLSPQAGAQILRSLKVKGNDEELEQAAKELGGHAFSLTLLGSYLDEVFNGDIQRRKEIENLFQDTRYGAAAESMIAAYEGWLGEGMELAILRLLGLFSGPADFATIEALRNPPVIKGLTEPLQYFKNREWNQAVAKLRRLKLLEQTSSDEALDTHPLVREHFKQQLRRNRPDVWREANDRMFEHLTTVTKDFPETIQEMSALYSAVAYGCAANRHEEALHEVYLGRIQRGDQHFNWHTLGAYGADLATLTGFFERLWDVPLAHLSNDAKSFVLSEVGVDLRSLGRLHEAVGPTKAGLEIAVVNKNWANASRCASNLTDLYVSIGDLKEALNTAQKGIEYADLSDDLFVRVVTRTGFADVLHRKGLIEQAGVKFAEAERLLAENSQFYPMLTAWYGFLYCELLLSQRKGDEVKDRALKVLRASKEDQTPGLVGLYYLSLARSWMLDSQESELANAAAMESINRAVYLLRHGGQIDRLMYGLLARAALYRQNKNFDLSFRDLSEVLRITNSSGMGLHLADYHLESARLQLAQGEKEKAGAHVITGKEMINHMGYHRRDNEVAELEAQLA